MTIRAWVIERTVAVAEVTPAEFLDQDAFTKQADQAAVLRGIADPSTPNRTSSSHLFGRGPAAQHVM